MVRISDARMSGNGLRHGGPSTSCPEFRRRRDRSPSFRMATRSSSTCWPRKLNLLVSDEEMAKRAKGFKSITGGYTGYHEISRRDADNVLQADHGVDFGFPGRLPRHADAAELSVGLHSRQAQLRGIKNPHPGACRRVNELGADLGKEIGSPASPSSARISSASMWRWRPVHRLHRQRPCRRGKQRPTIAAFAPAASSFTIVAASGRMPLYRPAP